MLFFSWLKNTIDTVCNRPDHLQRLSIVGSGIAIYPLVCGIIWIIWKGFGERAELMPQQLEILGMMGLSAMGLLALVIISLLGIIKGFHIKGPGGVEVDIQTTSESKDNDVPVATTVTTTTTELKAPAKPTEGSIS